MRNYNCYLFYWTA